jgi:hypothetical protein
MAPPPLLATAQVLAKVATTLTVGRNVLIDTFVADERFGRNLLGAPVLRQARVHSRPSVRMDSRQRARGMPTFHAQAVCRSRLIRNPIACVTPKIAADRCRRTPYLPTDLAGRKAPSVKVLNLVAFVLAQVCVAHVQFHLAVKLCGLPRLRRSTVEGIALQN